MVNLPKHAGDPAFYLHGLQHRLHRRRIVDMIHGEVGAASSYESLHRSSLSLVEVRPTAHHAAHVNLVLIDLAPALVFAGLNTALLVASRACAALGLPLRVVVLSVRPGRKAVDELGALLGARWPHLPPVRIVYQRDLAQESFADSDVWIPTFWVTAHALDVACRLGRIDRERAVYLVQDYEPSFFPYSTDSALARSTYHAGFMHLVNSTPLAAYIGSAEGIEIPPGQVFAPQLDLDRLERAAMSRRSSEKVRVLFYGRPSKPRNMFALGLTALRLALDELGEDVAVQVVSAGEGHGVLRLGRGAQLEPLGRLSWDGYFQQLGRTDLVLSLQASPHPSHPPLDAVVSGAVAVTNEVGGTRAGRHERLLAVEARAEVLARSVVDAVRSTRTRPAGGFDPDLLTQLGGALDRAVGVAVAALR